MAENLQPETECFYGALLAGCLAWRSAQGHLKCIQRLTHKAASCRAILKLMRSTPLPDIRPAPAGVPAFAAVKLTQLQPFGVAIEGLDICNASQAELDDIKNLLAWHGVAVLRGVNGVNSVNGANEPSGINKPIFNDADFVDFLQRLGQLTFTAGETPVAQHHMLNLVSNVGRLTPPKSVFHADTSYVRQPPAYTALRPVVLPAAGGETVFSSQFMAYDTLPENIKKRLADTQVLHRVSGLPPAAPAPAMAAAAAPACSAVQALQEMKIFAETQCWHPLFKVHPLSGRTALFLSTPQRCVELSGMAADQSRRVVELLYRHSTRQHRLYHHRWQADDLLIWDNRCTMHRGDHSAVVGDRVFHRGMVLADD